MSVGLLVDATCDLPSSVLERFNVNVIPSRIEGNTEPYIDNRSKESSIQFYNNLGKKGISHFKLNPLTSKSFVDLLKADLLYHYDNLLVIAPHLKLNETLTSVRQGILEIQPEIEQLRHQARLKNNFKVRVIESNNGFAGYGLNLYEALRLMGEKAHSVDQLKKPLDSFKYCVNTYVLPGEQGLNSELLAEPPFNVNWLALKKYRFSAQLPAFRIADNSFSKIATIKASNATNTFLELMYDEVTRNTFDNHLLNISYAGNLAHLRVLPTFRALHEHVKNKGGKMVHSVMSPSNGVLLGPGALSAAFSTKN
jgi:fatty acid-binding protein DegV